MKNSTVLMYGCFFRCDVVTVLKNIRQVYGIVKDSVADPCMPQKYSWDGLKCSFADSDPPRVTSLYVYFT